MQISRRSSATLIFKIHRRGEKYQEIADPTWAQIEEQLAYLVLKPTALSAKTWCEGTLELCFQLGESPAHYDYDCVTVHASQGNYLLTYMENFANDDDEVHTLTGLAEHAGQKMIWVGVEYFDPSLVDQDIAIVTRAFKEFFDTGTINIENYGLSRNPFA